MGTVFTKTIAVGNRKKVIKILNDDLENIVETYDILVCSAYKNDYVPLSGTVIGKLYEMGIDVEKLSAAPEINCKDFGVWISKTENDKFKRICCVELLDYDKREMFENNLAVDIILKKTFSTLKYAIEQASISGIGIKKILLPVLGAGSQGIEMGYIVPPLINQLTAILNFYDVEEIDFFEVDGNRASFLTKYLNEALNPQRETEVFISYSSKQTEIAYEIADLLKQNNISYWMAPDSIPPSSDYLDEIPAALTNINTLLLLLTPESEASVWVAKEVSTAMGSNKRVIPCQLVKFDISPKFTFVLDGCQIFRCYLKEDYKTELIKIIKENN